MLNTAAFHNIGCKVNSYETEAMIQQLTDRGYRLVGFDEKADVYIVNTCTVTGVADKKSRQLLHRAKKLNPDALVVAVGCYVQADPERALRDEAVDLIVGNNEKSRLAELIEKRMNAVSDINSVKNYDRLRVDRLHDRTRAFIKIQDGCNQFCSYCLIPYVRGRVRSRDEEDIINEIKGLASTGCREAVLTGIHLSSYGNDGRPENMGPALLSLVEKVSRIDGIERIRLGSLEPRIIRPEFVNGLAGIKEFCPHFHLSLQSGCNATLARMNRHYTTEEFREKCELIRDTFELPGINTDVIVGFPGETDEEFAVTAEYLDGLRLTKLHVFPYSLRKGTAAERLPGRVDDRKKEERSIVLLKITERDEADFAAVWSGKKREVLLEELVEADGKKYFSGHTREYVTELVPAEGRSAGELVVLGE